MHRILLALAAMALLTGSAQAQALKIWKCVLPGGTYEVALRSIISVSEHQYMIEGGLKISEVVIDTSGSTEARFYYMQTPAQGAGGPLGAATDAIQSRAQTAADHATSALGGAVNVSDLANTTVVKSYPTTTHAHTVEYRFGSQEDLDAVFKSVEAAWTSNTATSFGTTPATGTTTTGQQ